MNNGVEPRFYFYRDTNQNEIDLIINYQQGLSLIEIKSGKNYTAKDIKAFHQLSNTMNEIEGECIICTCDDYYRIAPGVFVYPFEII